MTEKASIRNAFRRVARFVATPIVTGAVASGLTNVGLKLAGYSNVASSFAIIGGSLVGGGSSLLRYRRMIPKSERTFKDQVAHFGGGMILAAGASSVIVAGTSALNLGNPAHQDAVQTVRSIANPDGSTTTIDPQNNTITTIQPSHQSADALAQERAFADHYDRFLTLEHGNADAALRDAKMWAVTQMPEHYNEFYQDVYGTSPTMPYDSWYKNVYVPSGLEYA